MVKCSITERGFSSLSAIKARDHSDHGFIAGQCTRIQRKVTGHNEDRIKHDMIAGSTDVMQTAIPKFGWG